MAGGRDWRRARHAAIQHREGQRYDITGGGYGGRNAPWCELSVERKVELGIATLTEVLDRIAVLKAKLKEM